MTPKSYFSTFAYPPTHMEPLPPPKYTPKDYVMIVEVHSPDNKLWFSQAVPGEKIPEFFQRGETHIVNLDGPPVWGVHDEFDGPYDSYDDFYRSLPGLYPQVTTPWKAKVHLMRLAGPKVIRLLDQVAEYEDLCPPDNDEGRAQNKLVSHYIRSFSTDEPASGRSTVILDRLGIRYPDSYVCEHGGMEPTLQLHYQAMLCGSKVKLGICGFSVDVKAWGKSGDLYDLSYLLEQNNLEYSQILEALPGWASAPVQPQQTP